MPKSYTIKDMQSYASDHNGACLSKEYIDAHTPLKWRCEKGHTWEADFQIIRQGGWCPSCIKKQQDKEERLEELKSIAKERGGICLSKEYINTDAKLEFKCKKGHIWKGNPGNVKNGSWCPHCSGNAKHTLQDMIDLAEKRGGQCLSKKYSGNKGKLHWKCKEGHTWLATPHDLITAGSWCPKCANRTRNEHRKFSIEIFNKIANEKGGKCLSNEYIGITSRLKFICKEGHIWTTAGNNIMAGKWCPECGHKHTGEKLRDSIDLYVKIAKSHQGKLLTTIYNGNKDKLKFQCSRGHAWITTAGGVKAGGWCPFCAAHLRAEKLKDRIETYYKIAERKGGKCLSKVYIDNRSKLLFQCSKKHEWMAQPQKIKAGQWCPVCANKRKGNRKTEKK